MTVTQQLKRSSTANKRPDPATLLSGVLALNYDAATGGVYYTNDTNTLTKIGPAQISATAPNSSPAGSTGNALGEFWYDTTNSELKIWDGTQWVVTAPGQNNVTYQNGGLQIRGLSVQNTAASTRVNFNNAQVNYNSVGLAYANGVFTNITGNTRTYTFDFQLNVSSVRNTGYISPYFIWFQKNNISTADLTGTYGLSSYNSSNTVINTNTTVINTSWTFTLDPGDTISCWASFDTAAVLTYAGPNGFLAANSGTRVTVAEIVTPDTGYQNGGWAEYKGATATASGNNALDWNNPVASASDFTLTYDSGTRSFVNNTTETRTYRFDAVVGGAIPGSSSVYTQWDTWFGKNNGGAVASNNRYAQIYQPKIRTANNQASAVKTISWVFELAPGELITTFWYSDVSFPINSLVNTPAGTIPVSQVCKLRITEIQAAQSPQAGGVWSASLTGPVTLTTTDTLVNWTSGSFPTIDTLTYSNGVFTFTGTQPRTFLISSQILFNLSQTQSYTFSWLQYNATTLSSSARYSYNFVHADDLTNTASSFCQVLTLRPGDTFSTWVYCFPNVAGNSIGGSGLGMDSGSSSRLWIVDITAGMDSGGNFGTITGVTAGAGLSGGGTSGVVSVALDPATSTTLGGVKQGSGFSVASDGAISAVAGGSNTQVQYLDGSTIAGEAGFTFNTSNNTLTVPAFDGTTFDCGAF
jgi:hypothetical protein